MQVILAGDPAAHASWLHGGTGGPGVDTAALAQDGMVPEADSELLEWWSSRSCPTAHKRDMWMATILVFW
jgi:hypothetical protein